MTKKQKKTLKRIIISAVLYLAIILASKLVAIPWYLAVSYTHLTLPTT